MSRRSVLLPHASSSVATARQCLRTELRSLGVARSQADDAVLVLSELLSNALRHAMPLPPPYPPDSVQVSWTMVRASADADPSQGNWVEVAVSDGGGESLPRLTRPSLSALGGRGLDIVQRVAARWGTEVEEATTTVWALIDVPVMAVARHPLAVVSPQASSA